MQVLPQAGHAVHEDVPNRMAEGLATFLIRKKIVRQKMNLHHLFLHAENKLLD